MKATIISALSVAAVVSMGAKECVEVDPADAVRLYDTAQAAGDLESAEALVIGLEPAPEQGKVGCYTNTRPDEQAPEALLQRRAGLVEEEECRLDQRDLGEFVVITSRYRYYSKAQPEKVVRGTKVVIVDKASNAIASMGYGDLKSGLVASR